MPDEDIGLAEKRVYEERREETVAYVASEQGVARVAISDDQIGRFSLVHQSRARDVAGAGGQLLVATDEDVLVGAGEDLEPTGFGPAVAVGVGDDPIAAGPDGAVSRLVGDEWNRVETGRSDMGAGGPGGGHDDEPTGNGGPPVDVRAIDGDLVGTADGVYRVGETLEPVGRPARNPADVRDVASAGPYAATADALFYRGEQGWYPQVASEASVVASDGKRAHAVAGGDLLAWTDEGWRDAGAPQDGVVGVAYRTTGHGARGPTVVVTGDGTVMLDSVTAKDGVSDWRTRSIGLTDVAGVAVP